MCQVCMKIKEAPGPKDTVVTEQKHVKFIDPFGSTCITMREHTLSHVGIFTAWISQDILGLQQNVPTCSSQPHVL